MTLLVGQSTRAEAPDPLPGNPSFISTDFEDADQGDVVGYHLEMGFYYRLLYSTGLATGSRYSVVSVRSLSYYPAVKQGVTTAFGNKVNFAPGATGGTFGCRAMWGFVVIDMSLRTFYYVEDFGAFLGLGANESVFRPTPYRDSVSNASLGYYGANFVADTTKRGLATHGLYVPARDMDQPATGLNFIFRYWQAYANNPSSTIFQFFNMLITGRSPSNNPQYFRMNYRVGDPQYWHSGFYGAVTVPVNPVDPPTDPDPPGGDDRGDIGSGTPVPFDDDYTGDDSEWPDENGGVVIERKPLIPVQPVQKIALRAR